MRKKAIGVWFPTIRAGTGTDIFTIRLATAFKKRGIQTHITWLPHHAEYLPWTVPVPEPPAWATVAHVNSWLPGRFIPRRLPLVVTVHSCVHDTALSPYKNPAQKLYHRIWIQRCEANAIQLAEVVTAVSHYTQKQAENYFSRHDIISIHNWVDTNIFSPGEMKHTHSPFRLLFAGNLNKRKGMDLLEKIMKKLGSDFRLDITCSQDDLNKLISSAVNITALGRINSQAEMAQLYRNTDALLFPTRLEGLALVALEAQACGRPVIATKSSSLPETLIDGKTGLLCGQDDVEAFAEAAQTLRTNAKRWSSMCEAARRHAVENFNEDKAVNSYLRIYENLNVERNQAAVVGQ
jgi:glycosyltransferase involved in cell wall biosynthesis